MVYAQKSPEVHIIELQLIITEIDSQNSIDKLKSDAKKIDYLLANLTVIK